MKVVSLALETVSSREKRSICLTTQFDTAQPQTPSPMPTGCLQSTHFFSVAIGFHECSEEKRCESSQPGPGQYDFNYGQSCCSNSIVHILCLWIPFQEFLLPENSNVIFRSALSNSSRDFPRVSAETEIALKQMLPFIYKLGKFRFQIISNERCFNQSCFQ